MLKTPSSPGPAGLLALGLGCSASPVQEPAMATSSASSFVEAPKVAPATPSSLVDLSGILVGQITATGVRFLDLKTGAERARYEIPRASAIVALPDDRWVVLADGGGRRVLVFNNNGEEVDRFTVPEAPAATRLLPDVDGFWIATAKGSVRYPLKAAVAGVHVSDARIENQPPPPISLARLTDGSLVSVAGGQIERRQGEGTASSTPLPEGMVAPVRLASGGAGAVWLAPWTGQLRRVGLETMTDEEVRIETSGIVYAVASGGGRVAWLDVLESAPAGSGTWTLHVAESDGTSLLTLELPKSGKRAFEESADRGLWLSPDGAFVAVGGRGALGVWRVADGGVVIAL